MEGSRLKSPVQFDLGTAGESSTLLVDFPKHAWQLMALHLGTRSPSLQESMARRSQVMENETELDKRDRWLVPMRPYHRVNWLTYYQEVMTIF